MNEWWKEHYDLMIASGMSREVVQDIIRKGKIMPRDGLFKFLDELNQKNIPLLVFSAGIGNMIKEFLEYNEKMNKRIHIISNNWIYDENGKVAKMESDKFVHTFNKNEFLVKTTTYFDTINKRKHVILLGDSLGDLNMVDGLPHDVVLKIGFLNEDVENNKKVYSEKFDAVILNDGDMNFVIDLLKNF